MKPWVINALLSMLFAGATTVLAKAGLGRVHPDVGLLVRFSFIFLFTIAFSLVRGISGQVMILSRGEWLFMGASALSSFLSWLFYLRALENGPASDVAIIDKASLGITLLLAFIFLGEPMTLKTILAAGLVMAGCLVLVWR